MSFQIVEIVEVQPERIRAVVDHEGHQMPATIAGSKAEDIVVGRSFPATIGYDEIQNWKVVGDFEDASSGVWQEQDGIHLLGRVHNILDYGDGKIIIDVYVQNGSDLFTVDSETVADALEANDGLEITVGRLYIYPNGN